MTKIEIASLINVISEVAWTTQLIKTFNGWKSSLLRRSLVGEN